MSPLHAAASGRNGKRAEIISILLDAGADVDLKTSGGFTPLACAVSHPFWDIDEVIALFHKAGADLNAKTNSGLSILKIAKENCANASVLELLKSLGAK